MVTGDKVSPQPPASISANEAYTPRELQARLGVGRYALREARKRGLKIRRFGRRPLILGSDVIRFLKAS